MQGWVAKALFDLCGYYAKSKNVTHGVQLQLLNKNTKHKAKNSTDSIRNAAVRLWAKNPGQTHRRIPRGSKPSLGAPELQGRRVRGTLTSRTRDKDQTGENVIKQMKHRKHY